MTCCNGRLSSDPPSLPPTRFTELVGCRLPVQLAGMGGVSTAALAGAVAAAGGLGMLGGAGLGRDEVVRQIDAARAIAGPDARVGVNFLMPFADLGALAAAAEVADVVECFYGDPDPSIVARASAHGALVSWQVGSLDEARAAETAGCRLVVVQGVEAGGHVRGVTPLLDLVESVRAAIDLPLVAAGGIGSGRALADALAAGADAVRLGTVLLAADEADVHPAYLSALTGATAADTVLTEAFSAGWPDAPHRVLRTALEASGAPPSERSPMPPTRGWAAGDVAAAALYAGTSVDGVRGAAPAAELIARLVRDAGDELAARAS